jgi:hypothetical protein
MTIPFNKNPFKSDLYGRIASTTPASVNGNTTTWIGPSSG